VKARGTFTFPRSNVRRFPLSSGFYFISANLGTRGIATWVASLSFKRMTILWLIAMSKTARAVRDPGPGFAAAPVPPGVLAGWGITTKTYGYAQSRACVK
jgi:hypothetical protein